MTEKDAYRSLAKKMGFPDSENAYKVLQLTITPDEAKLVDSLPATIKDLAESQKLTEKHIEDILDKLYKKGIVSLVPEGYAFTANVEQFQIVTTMRIPPNEEYDNAWKGLQIEVSTDVAKAPLPEIRYLRIIPYYKAVINVPGALPIDNLIEIFKAQKIIVLVECVCKRAMRACDAPLDVCFQFGARAENVFSRGIGKKLSVDEAIAALDKAENAKTPLVHSLFTNSQDLTDITALCNCCACCCGVNMADRFAHRKTWDLYAPSRFVNTVDPKACDGCKICIKRCNFGALRMVEDPVSKERKASVDPTKCVGCGSCVGKCPKNALALKVVRPLDFIPVVKQEMPLMQGWV